MTICLLLSLPLLLHILSMLYSVIALRKENKSTLPGTLPSVSVLVAARNEEKNILRCLEHLALLDYPADKLEVLIGDDISEDDTALITEKFISSGKSNFHLHKVKENMGLAKGKANVLAHLARQARGDVFFVTDADIAVPSGWIQAQLPYFEGKTVIVSGTSMVDETTDKLGKLQSMEWLYLMGFYHIADKQLQISANGNNMCFRAGAYFETGGYENIPFSVTEDYALMQAMKKLGYRHRHVLDPDSLCLSRPTGSFAGLLKQRNRWLTGGKDQPLYAWLLLAAYLLFLPLLLLLAICNPPWALGILSMKIILDLGFILRLKGIVKAKLPLTIFPIFEIYQYIFSPVAFIYFLSKSGKVEWKGRKYN